MKHTYSARTIRPARRYLRLAALFLAEAIVATSALPAEVTGPYFGQTPPGATPRLFAPGILTSPSTVVAVTRIAFSPDGNECFFSGPTDWSFSSTRMYYTRCDNNVWTPPVLTSFVPGYSCRQAYFSADGNTLYFSSNKNGNSDIWKATRTSQGWGTPQVLPAPFNTTSYDGAFTQTTDGTTYIESARPGGRGLFDLWRIPPAQPGQPQQAENLGPLVNSTADDYDPFVSRDGRYLIFGSTRSGGYGQGDFYVTFSDGNGGWTAATNLSRYIPGTSTGNDEYAIGISPEGRYLFFTRLIGNSGGLYWVANPFLPELAISLNDTNVHLSWSTNLPGFALETTSQLSGDWTPVPGVTGFAATLPVTLATNQFFRLKQ